MIRNKGFIDVNKMLHDIKIEDTSFASLNKNPKIRPIKNIKNSSSDYIFSFDYFGKVYFYKYDGVLDNIYNELIAEELAYDFEIECAHYDLAEFDGKKGVISENYKKEGYNYESGTSILSTYYYGDSSDNNLETIWNAFEIRYQNHPNKREIISNLMKQLVDVFIFDIIVCNYDRHIDNWELMEGKDEIKIGPIYDNERILTTTLEDSVVALTVYPNFHSYLKSELLKFQTISSNEFNSIIKDKLWIISERNLKNIFKRIESRTGYPMPKDKKEYYLDKYEKHLEMLENILKEIKENDYERKNR